MYVPDLQTNLLSVSKITDNGGEVIFKCNFAVITDKEGNIKYYADRRGDLYFIRQNIEVCKSACGKNDMYSNLLLWHSRLGHLNFRDVQLLNRRELIPGKMPAMPLNSDSCKTCLLGKITEQPFPVREQISKVKLEIIHTDLFGMTRSESKRGARYFITFTDDCTRWGEVYFLKNKSDAFDAFKQYKNKVENLTNLKIKNLQSDNGREFTNNNQFDDFLRSCGIHRRLTCVETPQQNGVAERRNRTLVEMARCMLIQASLSVTFWAEAVATANYIRNRCPTQTLDSRIPYERWTYKKLTFSHLRNFGSRVVVLEKGTSRDKFIAKGLEGIFVGYSEEAKAYRVWLDQKKRVFATRDVRFITDLESRTEIQDRSAGVDNHRPLEIDIEEPMHESESTAEEVRTPASSSTKPIASVRGRGRPRLEYTGKRGRPSKKYHMIPAEKNEEGYMEIYETPTLNTTENVVNSETVVNEPISQRRLDFTEIEDEFDNSEKMPFNEHFVGIAEIPLDLALKSSEKLEWLDAVYDEVKKFIEKDVFKIVERPNDRAVVSCRTVLSNKYGPNGEIIKRKARIVARGFSQEAGIDFKETFAPVARLSSLRLLVALAARYGMEIQ